jgi:hypothetical protein
MKVASVFSTSGHSASSKPGKMILPQLEAENHGAEGEPGSVPSSVRCARAVEGVQVGCFPDPYAALSGNPPDQVVTL